MAVAPAAAVSNNKEEGTDRPTTGFEGAPVVGKAFDGSPVTQQWEGETARKLFFRNSQTGRAFPNIPREFPSASLHGHGKGARTMPPCRDAEQTGGGTIEPVTR